jgi:hypothetical protein
MLKMENGVSEKEKEDKKIKNFSFELTVKKLQFLSGQEKIPFDSIYNPDKFLKKYNVSQEKINEWKEIEKEEMKKLNQKDI